MKKSFHTFIRYQQSPDAEIILYSTYVLTEIIMNIDPILLVEEILDSILFLLFNFLQNESINNFDLLKSVLSEYSLFVLRTTSNACYSKIINSMPLLCKLNLKKTMNFFIHNL